MERAVLLSKQPLIGPQDLPTTLVEQSQQAQPEPHTAMSLKKAMEGPEKAILYAALETHQWNRQETARVLQINRTTLYKKMRHYGLLKKADRHNQ